MTDEKLLEILKSSIQYGGKVSLLWVDNNGELKPTMTAKDLVKEIENELQTRRFGYSNQIKRDK